jgi:hypothetical protein
MVRVWQRISRKNNRRIVDAGCDASNARAREGAMAALVFPSHYRTTRREREEITERKKSLAGLMSNIAEIGGANVERKIGKASVRDAIIGTGVAIDKMLALYPIAIRSIFLRAFEHETSPVFGVTM